MREWGVVRWVEVSVDKDTVGALSLRLQPHIGKNDVHTFTHTNANTHTHYFSLRWTARGASVRVPCVVCLNGDKHLIPHHDTTHHHHTRVRRVSCLNEVERGWGRKYFTKCACA